MNGRVNADNRDDDAHDEVEGDEETIQGAFRSREETVHDASECYRRSVHSRCRSNQNPLPQIRVRRVLPVLETHFGPTMCEVDKEDKTEEDEKRCSYECNVVPPEHEKFVGYEERCDNKEDPEEYFRTPPPVLQLNVMK